VSAALQRALHVYKEFPSKRNSVSPWLRISATTFLSVV
jgi:hypothetical protein